MMDRMMRDKELSDRMSKPKFKLGDAVKTNALVRGRQRFGKVELITEAENGLVLYHLTCGGVFSAVELNRFTGKKKTQSTNVDDQA